MDASFASPSLAPVLLRTFFSLAVILGLAYLFLIVIRKGLKGPTQTSSLIQVLGRTHLYGKNFISIVKISDRFFVLGVTENQISHLGDLDESDLPSGSELKEIQEGQEFKDKLKKLIGR